MYSPKATASQILDRRLQGNEYTIKMEDIRCLFSDLSGDFVLANTSVRSPQKLYMYIIWKAFSRSKYRRPKKKEFENKITGTVHLGTDLTIHCIAANYWKSLVFNFYLLIFDCDSQRRNCLYDDDDVSFYNSTASTWTLATPRTTWKSYAAGK